MKRLYFCAVVSAALVAPLQTFAGEPLFLQVPVLIDPSAPIPMAVKAECGVDMLLGNYALSAIGRREGSLLSVAKPEQAGADKLVQLTILSVHGFGGGAWSGPKSMNIRADLKKGGTTVATTVLSRSSRGGVFGGMSGTCAILDRVAAALGKDVATWLARGAAARPERFDSNTAEPAEEPESAPVAQ
jgi:hypothetical protein